MQLKFLAREDLLVNDPSAPVMENQPIHRIGRVFVYAKRNDKGEVIEPAQYPVSDEPYVCESDSAVGLKLQKKCKGRQLWAFDAETARHCNVEFVPVEKVNGAWVQAKPKPDTVAEKKKA